MPKRSNVQQQVLKTKIFGSVGEIDQAIAKLHRRIDDVKGLAVDGLIDSTDLHNIQNSIIDDLRDIFGPESAEFDRYQFFRIWDGQLYTSMRPEYIQKCYRDGIHSTVKTLTALVKRLEERKSDMIKADEEPFWEAGKVQLKTPLTGNKIFIVHGHDQAAKEAVARAVEKLELVSIILHEQPDLGKTVIEKLEHNAEGASFAIVLLTPDDIGCPAQRPEDTQGRARQNVIFELGFFIGKLGRERVCVLYKDGVELPSDYSGVVYVPLDHDGAWRLKLAQNMYHAGIGLDANKLL